MAVKIRFCKPSESATDTRIVFAAAGGELIGSGGTLDSDLDGLIRRAITAARFEGAVGATIELLVPHGLKEDRLVLCGLGPVEKADACVFEKAGGAIAAHLRAVAIRAHIDMEGLSPSLLSIEQAAAHLAHGAVLRSYAFDHYRKQPTGTASLRLEEVLLSGADGAASLFARLDAVAQGVFYARDLVSEPPNIVFPQSFVERVRRDAPTGLVVEAFGEDKMCELGMGALLGVSQGSPREAQILTMRWNGAGDANETPIVLVGKGVTFDAGGITLKKSPYVEQMKWDMAGAAAVVGTMRALALEGVPCNVVGVCGLVENMPDGNAQRPGDVVTSMAGRTIEVINTDAEGRLVLADLLHWAQREFGPAVIIDMATLTGDLIACVGREYAGLFSNDDDLAHALASAGLAVDEKLLRLPMGEVYDRMIDSEIADMKNLGPPEAGPVTAAQFLARFVKEGVTWAHLDVTGQVWAEKAGGLYPAGATGFGVRLLEQYIHSTLDL
ncbi:leucyl aminopeptidase (plasmid) [Sphingobium sp. SJ10-10]|uniref:leucyl aminopeptidase n=1 Tax=Sphingobium sp. SJ10-10 TaxID=3114999 RepID=UPI002E188B12|nr:leucyl aminopeptidase [Sphingobium sp. SJ10-10]